ncbi:hypothetical protein PTTG_00074 [Puccinia triticina 1-1 BBBD Race 1]|uniref:Secreted protein n=2 Tax=Puccinia triticina TaxID=208348 RepID=A0A180GWS6_PUCT1|nr:uncharacterized protein PtA15_6A292 [Puccinia triticina]OAV96974.1 hypothetical protein PTTG_00074 [Puccinia triticina 1-1 BBBD Race 1]WAQ85664.1 hypothetical protein PtA15_6A292 [Puccinia triticina]
MVSLLLRAVIAALLVSVLPATDAIPMTTTTTSSSSSSSGSHYVNGQLVDAHCEASKNGYNSGCGDPTFRAVPDSITTVTPGNFMPNFPPFPNMNFGNGFPFFGQNQFPNLMNGFPPLAPQFPFNNFNPFVNLNNNFGAFPGFAGFPNF